MCSDLFFRLLLAEATGNEVSGNPEGFARFDSRSKSAGIFTSGGLPAPLWKSTSDSRLASFGLSRIIEPCNTLLLVPVACGCTDFAPLSFCSSVITGRPDDPSVIVFLFGSICTKADLILFVVDHWKHGKKLGKIARYVDFSTVEDGSVIGANTSVGFT